MGCTGATLREKAAKMSWPVEAAEQLCPPLARAQSVSPLTRSALHQIGASRRAPEPPFILNHRSDTAVKPHCLAWHQSEGVSLNTNGSEALPDFRCVHTGQR